LHDALVGVKIFFRSKQTGVREPYWTVDTCGARSIYKSWFDGTKGVALDSIEAVHPQSQDQNKLWIVVKGEHVRKYCKSVKYQRFKQICKIRIVANKAELLSDTGVEMDVAKDSLGIVFQEQRHRAVNQSVTFHKPNQRQVVDTYSTVIKF
jgi:hypothetical protein